MVFIIFLPFFSNKNFEVMSRSIIYARTCTVDELGVQVAVHVNVLLAVSLTYSYLSLHDSTHEFFFPVYFSNFFSE